MRRCILTGVGPVQPSMTEISQFPRLAEFKRVLAIEHWQSLGVDHPANPQDGAVDILYWLKTVKHDRSFVADQLVRLADRRGGHEKLVVYHVSDL